MLLVHQVLERFLVENGAMGNGLIIGYTGTLLSLSSIRLFLVYICRVIKCKIVASCF